MVITLFIFLVVYFVLAGVTVLFFLASLFHLIRFGTLNFATVFVSFVFLCGIIILAYFSYNYLIQVNWQESIKIFGGFSLPKLQINPSGSNF
jgi:hypothetical protein